MFNLQISPYSDNSFVGYVTLVSPSITNVHFPSSVLLKKFYKSDEGFHALTGKYVIIEGSGNGFLGKIIEIALPESERLSLTESRYDRESFHPTGKVEILLCFDNYHLKAKKGLDQLPPVGAKVYLCSNQFLGSLLTEFGNSGTNSSPDKLIQLANLPQDEEHIINVSAQALFGRHCAVVGTTGGGKSWTVAKLVQEVLANNGKAILIDATGEYKTLGAHPNVSFLEFNVLGDTEVYFDYRRLRETDLYALFRPTGQAQIPKLQEAMRSLRLVNLLESKVEKTVNDAHIVDSGNNFLLENESWGFKLLKKEGNVRQRITKAYKENIGVFDVSCNFDINALPYQVFNECVRDFGGGENYGASDTAAAGFCQSMISRILVTLGNEAFKKTFGFKADDLAKNELSEMIDGFLKHDAKKNVLIISVANIPSENKLREILVNAIGRFLLEKALKGKFKSTAEDKNKKSVLLFLDEAHLFLDKRIKDEYSIEVELDAYDRIAKECRKYGLFLILSTQMPRDIPKGVLSQMGTFIVHRLINQQDREAIEYACSEANRSALSFLPILSSGEAMLTGVDFPMPIVLKIREPEIKPNSITPQVF
ncbi:hypothetical protein EV200_103403 [Pedobacter psychrotolerans]|uniref:AAA+ ATPase domain-containing protein n=1 Tax=Pedobacter psychrotolerans TaxID=1843235 RepID=A0A4R2HF23_9SPHI|nr:ATP-binding protein [Pedobacter psychrotolerans]TCO27069.1 hypothetical protein EV200_103403 [Pedobacter psychrotolerans]GGE58665.1 hypothetical protein GCM10011413_26430 [Pedobacter psychrotolerans]